jgi:hypothetical protein
VKCFCWLFMHIFTARRLYKSFGVKGLKYFCLFFVLQSSVAQRAIDHPVFISSIPHTWVVFYSQNSLQPAMSAQRPNTLLRNQDITFCLVRLGRRCQWSRYCRHRFQDPLSTLSPSLRQTGRTIGRYLYWHESLPGTYFVTIDSSIESCSKNLLEVLRCFLWLRHPTVFFVSLIILIVLYVPLCLFCLSVLFCVLSVCECVLYYCHWDIGPLFDYPNRGLSVLFPQL